jgi:hypothetical protein
VDLTRRVIAPDGIRSFRAGWHEIPGERQLDVFYPPDTMAAGEPAFSRPPYLGPQTLPPAGIAAPGFGAATEIQLFHRELPAHGFDSMAPGASGPDTPYLWQRLRVGPRMPTIPQGVDTALFGTAWASFYVREVLPEGSDFFLSDYDFEAFDARMRVWRVSEANSSPDPDPDSPLPPLPLLRHVHPAGTDEARAGVCDARLHTHYVHPDGNADQYRKGAF